MSKAEAHGSDSEPREMVPYRVVDTSNRRGAGVVYLAAAGLTAILVTTTGVSLMWLTIVLPLGLLAAYQFVSGRRMKVTDAEAIEIASAAAPFDMGHASATLGFTGFTAKPVWQVLVFESGPAPEHQALVTVDALSGTVTGTYAEAVEAP
ncbi:MAG: hypothetical protein BMS9Abin12_1191 [Acidimicrobiia bacterium]|nr:MAG: hypothetical protein BMS9Abin12_1191 [Acidimicrobiia bacterium]